MIPDIALKGCSFDQGGVNCCFDLNEDGQDMSGEITFDDFMKVDIRAGTILSAEEFPQARKPAFKLLIDFGPEVGQKKSSAQITDHYSIDSLVGRQVSAVVNFPPRQIGPFMSEVLVLGFANENSAISLISADHPVPDGARLM